MTASTARWRGGSVVPDDLGMPRGPQRPGETVAASLRQRIAAGEWAPGEALPTVAVLAAEYDVARATVARALRVLEAEGLVRVIPRWGTFLAELVQDNCSVQQNGASRILPGQTRHRTTDKPRLLREYLD